MTAARDAEAQARICSVFSNAKRIQILWTLAEGEKRVSEIAAEVDTSVQNTSHHLRLMKDKGILTSRRSGRSVRYQILEAKLVMCLLPERRRLEERH
jgi:ArsR family transcriptional regulator